LAIHIAFEERHVGQINPAKRVSRHARQQENRQARAQQKAQPERSQPEPRVMLASEKLAAVIGRLLVHASTCFKREAAQLAARRQWWMRGNWVNPKGIPALSPRLRGTSYPGIRFNS